MHPRGSRPSPYLRALNWLEILGRLETGPRAARRQKDWTGSGLSHNNQTDSQRSRTLYRFLDHPEAV